jgi:hypothetical protein
MVSPVVQVESQQRRALQNRLTIWSEFPIIVHQSGYKSKNKNKVCIHVQNQTLNPNLNQNQNQNHDH